MVRNIFFLWYGAGNWPLDSVGAVEPFLQWNHWGGASRRRFTSLKCHSSAVRCKRVFNQISNLLQFLRICWACCESRVPSSTHASPPLWTRTWVLSPSCVCYDLAARDGDTTDVLDHFILNVKIHVDTKNNRRTLRHRPPAPFHECNCVCVCGVCVWTLALPATSFRRKKTCESLGL